MAIKAGLILTQEFDIASAVDEYSGIIDYYSNEEKTRTTFKTDDMIDEAETIINCYGGIIDYMGNKKKTIAVFDKNSDALSMDEVREYKKKFDFAQTKGCNQNKSVVSFDNEWLNKTGLRDEKSGYINDAKLRQTMRICMRTIIEEENFHRDSMWVGAIHYNKEHIHIHASIIEPESTRKVITEGKYKGQFRGMLSQTTINKAKARMVNNILSMDREHELINELTRNVIVGNLKNNTLYNDKELSVGFMNLYSQLPKENKKWFYKGKEIVDYIPMVDDLSRQYLMKYCKDEYSLLKEVLEKQSGKYLDAYGQTYKGYDSKNQFLINKEEDLFYRMGNAILKQLRLFDKLVQNNNSFNKEELVPPAPETGENDIIDNKGELVPLDINNLFKQATIINNLHFANLQGDSKAAGELGDIYAKGLHGISLDMDKAVMWYGIAANPKRNNPDTKSAFILSNLLKKENPQLADEFANQVKFYLMEELERSPNSKIIREVLDHRYKYENMLEYYQNQRKITAQIFTNAQLVETIITFDSQENIEKLQMLGDLFSNDTNKENLEVSNSFEKMIVDVEAITESKFKDKYVKEDLKELFGRVKELNTILESDVKNEDINIALRELENLQVGKTYEYTTYLLGKFYMENKEHQDLNKSEQLLLDIENGFFTSFVKYRLGKIYLSESNLYDIKKSMSYLKESAELNNQYAQYTLGKILVAGQYEQNVDKEKGEAYIKQSAEQGNVFAKYYFNELKMTDKIDLSKENEIINYLYINSTIKNKDYKCLSTVEQAIPMLEDRKMISNTKYAIGKLYLTDYKQCDTQKGMKYLRESAELNNQYAQYTLGTTYYYGNNGIKRNETKGLQYLKQSRDNGNVYAQQQLVNIERKKFVRNNTGRNLNNVINGLKKSLKKNVQDFLNEQQHELLLRQEQEKKKDFTY